MDEEDLQDHLEIHFQKPSNYGGEVENIKYVPDGAQLTAFFSEDVNEWGSNIDDINQGLLIISDIYMLLCMWDFSSYLFTVFCNYVKTEHRKIQL